MPSPAMQRVGRIVWIASAVLQVTGRAQSMEDGELILVLMKEASNGTRYRACASRLSLLRQQDALTERVARREMFR